MHLVGIEYNHSLNCILYMRISAFTELCLTLLQTHFITTHTHTYTQPVAICFAMFDLLWQKLKDNIISTAPHFCVSGEEQHVRTYIVWVCIQPPTCSSEYRGVFLHTNYYCLPMLNLLISLQALKRHIHFVTFEQIKTKWWPDWQQLFSTLESAPQHQPGSNE